jgi:glycerol uptake facilitator-like aquaporin
VIFKGIIAATASVALMVTPAVAAAQSSAQAATTEVAPAGETITEGSQLRGGFIIPLIAIIAIILGILAATNDNDDDLPHSP